MTSKFFFTVLILAIGISCLSFAKEPKGKRITIKCSQNGAPLAHVEGHYTGEQFRNSEYGFIFDLFSGQLVSHNKTLPVMGGIGTLKKGFRFINIDAPENPGSKSPQPYLIGYLNKTAVLTLQPGNEIEVTCTESN